MELIEKLKKNTLQTMDGAAAVAEVLGAMTLSKKFPRNMEKVKKDLFSLCQNKDFAESSFWQVPRKGKMLEGASIRLAEAAALAMTNIHYGITTALGEDQNSTTFTVYALDLESNTKVSRTFTRKHERNVKGKIYPIFDPNAVYELIASDSSKRLRVCLFGVIPGYLIDAALEKCKETLRLEKNKDETVQKIVQAFQEHDVSRTDLEKYLDKQLSEINSNDLMLLRGALNGIKQGITTKEDIFKKEGTTDDRKED